MLDWELSTLGHPLADFSYHCMSWHIEQGGPFRGLGSIDHASLGIPTEREYVDMYCRRMGRAPVDPGHWNFYLAYNLFRGAGITQGIMKRVQEGTAASLHAVEAGKKAAAAVLKTQHATPGPRTSSSASPPSWTSMCTPTRSASSRR